MKHLKTLCIVAALMIGMVSVHAQSKVAHINTKELIEAMPEMLTAKAELEKLAKTYENEIKTMAAELETKAKQYAAEEPNQTKEENDKRVLEVQTMEQSIRQYQQQAQQDLLGKENEIVKPIYERAKAAIQKVATAQGYLYVLDSQVGSGVIVADGKDLMADVKKELGF